MAPRGHKQSVHKQKCAARISGAIGDELKDYPTELKTLKASWENDPSKKNGIRILKKLEK